MNIEEIKLLRLAGQHLPTVTDTQNDQKLISKTASCLWCDLKEIEYL